MHGRRSQESPTTRWMVDAVAQECKLSVGSEKGGAGPDESITQHKRGEARPNRLEGDHVLPLVLESDREILMVMFYSPKPVVQTGHYF